ncbi:hypothetical protein ANN_18366 [Periplaneta americana]|uniref:Uncharacterized protein n=1 Tax=Periplaneta americana TaxID=6978 RepID=A0ABQ8SNJ2_PERAM|nr:hypothetical protein ANN_18366 [Periplaneta americana]
MMGLFEGGNEPPCSLQAISSADDHCPKTSTLQIPLRAASDLPYSLETLFAFQRKHHRGLFTSVSQATCTISTGEVPRHTAPPPATNDHTPRASSSVTARS